MIPYLSLLLVAVVVSDACSRCPPAFMATVGAAIVVVVVVVQILERYMFMKALDA